MSAILWCGVCLIAGILVLVALDIWEAVSEVMMVRRVIR